MRCAGSQAPDPWAPGESYAHKGLCGPPGGLRSNDCDAAAWGIVQRCQRLCAALVLKRLTHGPVLSSVREAGCAAHPVACGQILKTALPRHGVSSSVVIMKHREAFVNSRACAPRNCWYHNTFNAALSSLYMISTFRLFGEV